MKKLEDVSTRQLLETLRMRGVRARIQDDSHKDNEHLEANAEHLLTCLSPEVLNYPFTAEYSDVR